MAEESILDEAIARIEDEALRQRIAREVELLRGSRRFGLVFDRHLPESVRLAEHPIRKGVTVGLRDESSPEVWRVNGFTDHTRQTAILSGDGGAWPISDLIVVREFGEPVFPGLVSVEQLANGGGDAPWHTVINGENFHVLQALRSTHKGKVDLIYIDPPYNTGNEGWIYNDRYVADQDRAKSSKWLSFVERRLLVARDLLKSTGVIIVAIGDDEHHRLRLLLDQIFGDQNFLSDVVWQGGRKNDSRYVSNGADYMLIYARDESAMSAAGIRWTQRKQGVDEALAAAHEAWSASEQESSKATKAYRAWLKANRASLSDGVARYNAIDEQGRVFFAGDLSSPNPRPNLQYDVIHPATGQPVRRPPAGWSLSRESMDRMIAEDRIVFGTDHTTGAYQKRFLAELTDETASSVFERDRRAASGRLKGLLGEKRFPNPKDHEVLMRWIRLAAPSNAVIVDFFGGSGTTTEAALRLNAEDGGTRQSILVTNNEVGAKQARELRKAGHHPGDAEWEQFGVFEYVTRPRISTVVTGKRPDGSAYSDGVDANVEFFRMTYLDPGMVRRGREFAAIAPLLWLEASATGDRIDKEPDAGWAMTDHYGILFTVDAMGPFAAAVAVAAAAEKAPRVVFIITDSPTEFQAAAERLPVGIDTVRLYESYLANYTINVLGGAR